MPKFTKPYWVDWQDSTRSDDGWNVAEEQPAVSRATVKEVQIPADLQVEAAEFHRRTTKQGPAQRPPQEQPQYGPPGSSPNDPRATIIDHIAPSPGQFSGQSVIDVDPGGPNPALGGGAPPRGDLGDSPGVPFSNALTVRPQPGAVAHPTEPPNVVIAAHDFRPELATDSRLVLVREPDESQAAAFRVLRHQIELRGSPQVITVTSSLPGEGKTTTAVNLALALCECARARVLLVEGNFRKPRLAQVFRFEPPWCFAQQISEHRTQPLERWSVVEIAPHGLHVAAVDPRSDQRPLLDAPAFNFAIDRLRQAGYDHIVIDGPSVLGSAEVNLLQDAGDGVLLVCRSNVSHRKHLRAAIEQLAPGSILGVTLLEE